MTNYYHILGLNPDAQPEDIKQAYRKLSMKFHPDKNPDDKYFEEWTKKVNEAYETLSNPLKRADYDIDFAQEALQKSTPSPDSYPGNEEYALLKEIRIQLPEYYEAKGAMEVVKAKYDQISDQDYPVIITTGKAVLCVLGILAGIAGLWYALMMSNK